MGYQTEQGVDLATESREQDTEGPALKEDEGNTHTSHVTQPTCSATVTHI